MATTSNPAIRRALKKGFKSGGDIGDIGGGTGARVSSSGGGSGGSGSGTRSEVRRVGAEQAAAERQAEEAKQEPSYLTQRQQRVSQTYQKLGYQTQLKDGTVTATRTTGGRTETIQIGVGGQIKQVEAPKSATVNLTATPTKREQTISKFKEEAKRAGKTVKAKAIVSDGQYRGLAYVAEEKGKEPTQEFSRLAEEPYGASQFRSISEFKKTTAPRQKSFMERVDISISSGEPAVSFFSKEADIYSKEAPLGTKLAIGSKNYLVASGYGFGKFASAVRRNPIGTAATLILFSTGSGAVARGASLVTGLGIATTKTAVGFGALGGFGVYKEIKEPGSITTPLGAISTVTEFASYAVGAKAVGVAYKGVRIAGKKYIPYFKTGPKIKSLKVVSPEVIPQYQGSTRLGSAKMQYSVVGKEQTLYSSTVTKPSKFFGIASKTKASFGKAKFTVKPPPKGSVGPERARFGEDYFYFSRGETYSMFGEQGAARLGATPRGSGFFGYVKSIPSRFGQLFLRTSSPTILRLNALVSGFSKEVSGKIKAGSFGSSLRRTINLQIKSQPGKIFPGPKTSGFGTGEIEYVSAVGSPFYRLTGPQRFTYSPTAGQFQKVVDIGLQPGKAPSGPYNLKGRISNIKDIFLTDIFGIRGLASTGLPTAGARITTSRVFRTTAGARPLIRTDIRTRQIVPQVRSREIFPRVRTRTREIEPRVRIREPRVRIREPRTRVTEPRVRTRTRDILPRPRERVVRSREPRIRERPIAPREPRVRIREPRPITKVFPPVINIKDTKVGKSTTQFKKILRPSKGGYLPQLRASGEEIFGKKKNILTGIGFERPIIAKL